MATYTGRQNTADVIGAGLRWKERCLIGSASVFSEKPLWTARNLDGLKSAFVDHPLLGTQTFIEKLQQQLAPAANEVKQLAAEALWLLYLFVSRDKFGEALKRERVRQVWQLSGEVMPETPLLSDQVLEGLGNPGAAFSTKVPNELEYLVLVMRAWKGLDDEERMKFLSDPWLMADWVQQQPGSESRGFRHMLLYFCFPEHFERISSWRHKRKILASFSSDGIGLSGLSGTEIDKAIFSLRKRLENEYQTEKLDFYLPPLRERWLKAAVNLPGYDVSLGGLIMRPSFLLRQAPFFHLREPSRSSWG